MTPAALSHAPPMSFNSATAAEPWRSPHPFLRPAWNGRASIRPRLRSRGDRNLPPRSENAPECFNSATAAEPWRCRFDAVSIRSLDRLQFGHGCGAVEILENGGGEPGNVGQLQFGHGCGAVEMASWNGPGQWP